MHSDSDSEEFLFFKISTPFKNVCEQSKSFMFDKPYEASIVIQNQLKKFVPLNSRPNTRPPVLFKDFRSMIIASFKKSIKDILTKKYQKTNNDTENSEFKYLINENKDLFYNFSYSKSQVFNSLKESETQLNKKVSRTYSNTNIKEMLQSDEIRRALKLFYKIKFRDTNISSLQKKFKITCCHNTIHQEKCHKKWTDLEQVLLEQYI